MSSIPSGSHIGAKATIQKDTFGIYVELKHVNLSGEKVNISYASGASDKQITLRKPDGTTSVANATFTTDGTDGLLRRLISQGELDDAGSWYAQSYLKFTGAPANFDGFTSIVELEVKENL